MRSKRSKIRIVWFAHDLYDPRIIHACTDKGQQLTLTKCVIPEKRRCKADLYSDGMRHFFSLTHGRLGEVFDVFSPSHRIHGMHCHNGKRGNLYPKMREFGNKDCHIIVLFTFQGPRPLDSEGHFCQGDHKNGDVTDYCNDNLEWVPRKENRRRMKVLAALRSIDINPVQVPYNILDIFLNPKIISDMDILQTRLTALRDLLSNLFCGVFTPDEFRHWLTMRPKAFKKMLSKYRRTQPLDPAAEPLRDFDPFIERDDPDPA